MGPLIEPPHGKLADGLTTLAEGESWLLEPHQIGPDPCVWSPGIRTGVRPGSAFHTTEYFGPILGIMHATDLAQAIEWQNATDYGLTAGIQSLDADEVSTWIDTVQAGNLYVNRGITGAIVRRQPFGGWKRSSVGTTAKAGGPGYLTHLGTWVPRPLRPVEPGALAAAVQSVLAAAAPALTASEREELRAAAGSDQAAWDSEYGVAVDVSRLGIERNVLRYVPVPVAIRCDGHLRDLVRVLLAAARAGAPVSVSSPSALPDGLTPHAVVEPRAAWVSRMAVQRPTRIRLVGTDPAELSAALEGDPDVAIYAGAVTPSGRIEALPFVQEQAISITQHRFGTPDAELEQVLPGA